MSDRGRRALLLAGLAGLALPLAWALAGLAPFGHYPGPSLVHHPGSYGIALSHLIEGQRHVSGLVTAIVVDYRALDTLGEEFILLGAAVGCTVLLRARRAEREEEGAESQPQRPEPSFAMRSLGSALVGPLVVLGLYVVAHGQVSPGGGFQGGVVLAAGLLAAYVAGQAVRLRRVRPEGTLEVSEALGAAGFAALGVAGLLAGGAALENVLGLGTPAQLLSGGTMLPANVAIAIEVTGAVALVLSEFLDQTLVGAPEE